VRVAALYDVHGMPWALEAVLADVGDVDAIVFGGDLLHGPDPAGAVALARAAGTVFVRGNCEREPEAWDRAHVDADQLDWLAALPLAETIDGVLYCHATPRDDMPITTVFTPDELIEQRFGGFAARTVVIGHTHHQFDRRVGELRVVNAGSVGMPYEDDVAAYWLNVDDGDPSFRRTPFDVERAAAAVRRSGWPEAEGFIAENLLVPPSREEAVAFFEAQNA
jgi:diadenosine tetraphosphatase ApaH/serine/threonine PP2A family protein phosphatase